MKNEIIEFDKLDFREFILIEGYKYKVVLHQIDILRLINICKNINSTYLESKLKRAIYIKDYLNNTKTNFNRDLPKSQVENQILSPRDLMEYKRNQRKIDEDMKIFYSDD
jgi:hypothetical protein